MNFKYLVLDCETVPVEINSDAQQHYLNIKKNYDPNSDDIKICSTDPLLAKIICIALFYKYDNVTKYIALTGEEKDILIKFWDIISKLPDDIIIVHFNGNNFDIPLIRARSIFYNLKLSFKQMQLFYNSYSTKSKHNIDMSNILKGDKWVKGFCTLDMLCYFCGIESPKNKISGSDVYKYYYEIPNGINTIAEYCLKDVQSTAKCYEKLKEYNYV